MKLEYYLLLVYPALLFALLFFKAKCSKSGEFNEDFLSPAQTKNLLAAACIAVILHHLVQAVTGYGAQWKGPVTIIANIGILFTSMFFFCSGFGLYVSYQSKENYLHHFLSHRLTKILVPFFMANIILTLQKYYTVGHVGGAAKALKYIFGLILINSNGWYMVEITFLYIAFYLAFRYLKNKDIALVIISIFTLALILFAKSRGHDYNTVDANGSWFRGEWWYNSTIVFVFGLYFGRFRAQLTDFMKKHYKCLIISFSILLIIIFNIEEIVRNTYGYYNAPSAVAATSYSTVTLIAQSILCLVYIFWMLLITLKVSFSNKALSYIGTISTELFLIHKLFLEKINLSQKLTDSLYFLLVIILSLLGASVLYLIDKLVFLLIEEIAYNLSGLGINKNLPAIFKKLRTSAAIIVVCALVLFAIFNLKQLVTASFVYTAELEQLNACNIGDTVYYGHYDTSIAPGKERLEWIVLDKNEESCLLITAQGISCGTYNASYEETNWLASSLRARLNGNEFLDCFSKYEIGNLKKDMYEDSITLLTPDEALQYFTEDNDRVLAVTQIARMKGANENTYSKIKSWDYKSQKGSWWWLRSNESSITTPVITVDGEISTDGKYVNKPNGSIRPVIRVSL